MAQGFLRYNAYWPKNAHPAQIELACIKQLGQWKDKKGNKCGKGLPFHVKEFMKLAWPDMYFHRWSDLLIEEFLRKTGRVGCFGPSSSQKSFIFSRCALVMFYGRPQGTTCLITSTTRDALTRRIWDYVVSSHVSAKRKFDWLPGSLIESKLMLLADESTVDGRSFKNGVVGVACFSPETLIDTPTGSIKISDVKIGDMVVNAIGSGAVSEVHKRYSKSLFRIYFKDGKTIDCTEEHPFMTQHGWKKCRDLSSSDMVLSAHETLRIMQLPSCKRSPSQEILFNQLSSEASVRSLRKEFSTDKDEHEENSQILLSRMRESLGVNKTVAHETGNEEVWTLPKSFTVNPLQSRLLFRSVPKQTTRNAVSNLREEVCFNSGVTSKTKVEILQQKMQNGSDFENEASKKYSAYTGRTYGLEMIPGCDLEFSPQDRIEAIERKRSLVQIGSCFYRPKTRRRNRWWGASHTSKSNQGPSEEFEIRGSWVDRVEILESRSDKRFDPCKGGYPVYNIEVEGHPSYSVKGMIVHNCKSGGQWNGIESYVGCKNEVVIVVCDELNFVPIGVMDALANLESNDNCYFAGMGNLPDIHNPLGKLCEPKMGWETLPDTEKTRVFETKWINGRAIQLIGTDSPNLDYPAGEEPFKNLIGRRYIEQCANNYGRESDKFNMFASGKIPRSSMNRTVFTKSQCLKFHAMEGVTWGHTALVRGYGMDAAYSGVGGDRTVGFPFIFGQDVAGIWRLLFGKMTIYPGSDSPKTSHAEAIAAQCKQECDAAGIPPEHVFYDGTGRSELTIAFARNWSSKVVPIEFGGCATERPSFTGERHLHGDSQGEVKTCKEAFDRFVSELWFALSYGITSEQIRGLSEEAIDEGSQRKWELIRGAKQSIETKDDMKERGLRSPDICDGLVCAVEGARRLGFPLGKSTGMKKTTYKYLEQARADEWNRLKEESLAV